MLAVRFTKFFAIAAVAGLLAGCAANQSASSLPADTGRAAAHGVELPELPKPEPFLWEFAGVPRRGKAILVNIPSYELIAFEDGKPVLRSRVIVGSRKNRTPVMRTETSVVRFRPTWTPTPDMIRNEGIRPGTRPAGRRNPLGLLAIRLEPGMLIYLHGTNKPRLFNRERRALSHGCVRVEKWDEVAAWVLNASVEEVHKHAKGRRTFDMDTNFVPVILGYFTQFPDAEGNWQTYADVYRRGHDGPPPPVVVEERAIPAAVEDRELRAVDGTDETFKLD